jgi:DNA-binding transcriptional ArsR family regulator
MAKRRSFTGPGAPVLTAGVAEIRALAHPLRLRIMELFAEAPRTTKQVADILGEPPTRLYHHVAALDRAGLIRLKETRKNRGTTEKWFEAIGGLKAGAGATHGTKRRSKTESAARRALALTVLAQSRQDLLAAMNGRGGERAVLARVIVVAPPTRLAEIRRRLLAMLDQIREEFEVEDPQSAPARDDAVARWAVTLTFAPRHRGR